MNRTKPERIGSTVRWIVSVTLTFRSPIGDLANSLILNSSLNDYKSKEFFVVTSVVENQFSFPLRLSNLKKVLNHESFYISRSSRSPSLKSRRSIDRTLSLYLPRLLFRRICVGESRVHEKLEGLRWDTSSG